MKRAKTRYFLKLRYCITLKQVELQFNFTVIYILHENYTLKIIFTSSVIPLIKICSLILEK